MSTTVKKTAAVVCILSLLAAMIAYLPIRAAAEDDPKEYKWIIDDDADLLTQAEEDALVSYMEPLLLYGNAVFLTINENDGTAKDFTENYYNVFLNQEAGILILMDMKNMTLRIDSRKLDSEHYTSAETAEIVSNIIEFASSGQYYQCAATGFLQTHALLQGRNPEEAYAMTVPELEIVETQPASDSTTGSEPQQGTEPTQPEGPAAAEKDGEHCYYREVTENGYEILINDEAALLTQEDCARLVEVMRPITQFGNAAFVTLAVNPYDTAETYCYMFYDAQWLDASTALLVLDMENRVIRIENNGEIFRVVDENYSDTITDNVYKLAGQGDYYGCAEKAFTQMLDLLNGQRIAQPMKYICNALLAVIGSMVMMFFLVNAVIRKKAPSNDEMVEHIDYTCEIGAISRNKIRTAPRSSGTGSSGHSSSRGSFFSGSGSSGGSSWSSRSSSGSGRSSSSGNSHSSSSGHSHGGGQHRF